ncbi:OmpA family protein [Thalassolituus sp. UBA2009]|jgi:outer membrane protein OmpA-like peptidoglycan-associated protein|uniref:OmpA family protein n=1 Tax=Thalassolituus sp. UBA2009 TaxID=1947658 RepID=UPI000C4207D4|nr:OmpA family protein [Thalassolituus sp. UBA2009]MAY14948.1 cell envelope biogenesis protein OmpA [Oceanospirillaceae bacterium]|tara:strand:+ start:724 stop:1434 length:711 start_codon:yes stop_codon:yes gene_type:complete
MNENELEQLKEQEGHWVAVSDLMAGLMMVFMLISIVFMINVEQERDKIRDVAILYDHLRVQLYEDLKSEFADDMQRWGAELDKDLTFRFNNTEVLFDKGAADLKPEFQSILADFFPRYIGIITREKYRDDILEVRIEGHTSSAWYGALSDDDAYIRNMDLSQKRTRSALGFVLELPDVSANKDWLKSHLTANGLSSAKVVRDDSGVENDERSRRVEFKVRTDAEGRIATILDRVLP